jgi:hypothetical protein
MALTLALLFALMQAVPYVPAKLERSAPVAHPPNIIASSWVVLDVEVRQDGGPGSIVRLLGDNPFVDLAVTSVRGWTFTAARNPMPTESHVTAVFLFRAPNLFGGSPVALPASTTATDRPPLLVELWDPGYPPTSVGEGATIVELQTGEAGNIEGSRVISDASGLASFTEQGLQSWKFQPAIREGKPSSATVIAVVSYLRPVTTIGVAPSPPTPPTPPTPPGPPPTPPAPGTIIRRR